MLCESVKNKSSTERCSAKALKNLRFCGKHAKMKVPRLWIDKDDKTRCVLRIQKIWRGIRVRRLMNLQGPGVLNRTYCHNDEDLVTCQGKTEVHPGNYFSFDEGGKIYWFDFRSIYSWSLEHIRPTNPFTRQELTLETRQRIKEIAFLRENKLMPLFHDLGRAMDFKKVFVDRWMLIGQYLDENMFEDISPVVFTEMNRTQFWLFSSFMCESLLVWAKEKKHPHSRRNIYYAWMKNCWRRQTLELATTSNVAYYVAGTLLKILKDCKQPYEVCFQIMSARHRV